MQRNACRETSEKMGMFCAVGGRPYDSTLLMPGTDMQRVCGRSFSPIVRDSLHFYFSLQPARIGLSVCAIESASCGLTMN